MQQNVAHALGYTAEKRAPESARCPRCGGGLIFETDTIGRVLESCEKCSYSEGCTPVSTIEGEEARRRALLEQYRNRPRPGMGKPTGARICTRCERAFEPRSGNQQKCGREDCVHPKLAS